ncbi:metal ABC transporter permease [Trueperella sp. LYQ143]|uniref:metal ABC transporter permease n=1 Tax=unclassified Trueperella TaxID=2630174 RepID=UPI003983C6DD
MLIDMLHSPLMQRALIVAFLVGLSAPVVGTYLVQRRLTLLGDGIGHVALTGVACGWLAASAADASSRDAWAIPGAILASVCGALLIEWMRARGHASGDVALAILFYGGIAGGVLLIGMAGGTTANLNAYLFGSISTVTQSDTYVTIVLAVIILLIGIGLRPVLFTLCHDEEYARSCGIPTQLLSVLISVTAALTVSLALRIVGALLVSALMIIPVAIAQTVTHSFKSTMHIAMVVGVIVAESGLVITYIKPWSPGATIVVLAVIIYALATLSRPLWLRHGSGAHIHHHPHPHITPDVTVQPSDNSPVSPEVR